MELSEAYELMGVKVTEKLTPELLTKRYHTAAKKAHPDLGGSQQQMEKLNEAKEILEKLSRLKTGGVGINPFGTKVQDETILESKFQSECVKAWESIGGLCFNVHGHGMQKAGWPDLQLYHLKWTGQLELKVGDNKPSEIQKIVIRDLRARKTPAFVFRLRQGWVYLEDENGMELARANGWRTMPAIQRAELILKLVGGL
jgi:hypothetical protein